MTKPDFDPIKTGDGSITFFNTRFRQHYHSVDGAWDEARSKYLKPSRLDKRLQTGPVRILDVCFGLGYNSLAAIDRARSLGGPHQLSITALELDRAVVDAYAALAPDPFHQELLQGLLDSGSFSIGQIEVEMLWGDARGQLNSLANEPAYDLVYHDPFSPMRCSQLWTVDFFAAVKRRLKPQAALLTYSHAYPVLAALIEAGFDVGISPAEANQRPGIIASVDSAGISEALPAEQLEQVTRTARRVPFRDEDFQASHAEVLDRRQKEMDSFREKGF